MGRRYHCYGRVDWYPAGAATTVQLGYPYLIHDSSNSLEVCAAQTNEFLLDPVGFEFVPLHTKPKSSCHTIILFRLSPPTGAQCMYTRRFVRTIV